MHVRVRVWPWPGRLPGGLCCTHLPTRVSPRSTLSRPPGDTAGGSPCDWACVYSRSARSVALGSLAVRACPPSNPQVARLGRGSPFGAFYLMSRPALTPGEVPSVDLPRCAQRCRVQTEPVGGQGCLWCENMGWISFTSKTFCWSDRPW